MDGSGTIGDPYIVTSGSDLEQIVTDMGADVYWKQANDIDISGYANWTPIGPNGTPFVGHYDGDNFTIQNLTITGSSTYRGFFGYISGEVKNLKFTGASVSGGNYTGILCGAYGENAVIDHIRVGDAATSGGTITGSQTGYGAIAGYWLGSTNNGYVTDCFANAIVNCTYARASIAIGYTHRNGTLENIGVMGTLNLTGGAKTSGGVAGELLTTNGSNLFSYCAINLNSSHGTGEFGGLGGTENYQKDDCVCDNDWTVTAGNGYAAVAGDSPTTFTGVYYNSEEMADDVANGGGGGSTGLTTAQMDTQSNFSDLDFGSDWVMRAIPGLSDIVRPWLQCMTDVLPEVESGLNVLFLGGGI